MALRRRGLPLGSPPPLFAAMEISFDNLLKILPRLASIAPLKRLTFDHLLCPAIGAELSKTETCEQCSPRERNDLRGEKFTAPINRTKTWLVNRRSLGRRRSKINGRLCQWPCPPARYYSKSLKTVAASRECALLAGVVAHLECIRRAAMRHDTFRYRRA